MDADEEDEDDVGRPHAPDVRVDEVTGAADVHRVDEHQNHHAAGHAGAGGSPWVRDRYIADYLASCFTAVLHTPSDGRGDCKLD